MNSAFARVSRATAARRPADASVRSGSGSDRSASRRLRSSQQPSAVPIRDIVQSGGMRPVQNAVVRPAELTPSRGVPLREGDGAGKLRIQRCGIGSSCDCPPHDRLAGIGRDLQRATSAGGTPLPASFREQMESAFSFDFAGVRIHADSAAHDSASALGARALTAGTDIFFRAGEYLPGTPGGDRLLAHELAHVVQQRHGLPQNALDAGATDHWERAAGLAADHASPAAEREAHGAAMIAAMGQPVPALSGQPLTIARQDDLDAGTQEAGTQSEPPSDAGLLGGAGTSPPDTGTADAGASQDQIAPDMPALSPGDGPTPDPASAGTQPSLLNAVSTPADQAGPRRPPHHPEMPAVLDSEQHGTLAAQIPSPNQDIRLATTVAARRTAG